ncbi:alcohol dehydrogenase [Sesbania bispinosa]|nr:alcohol dehydrogenase [Sesbania bispinosa]
MPEEYSIYCPVATSRVIPDEFNELCILRSLQSDHLEPEHPLGLEELNTLLKLWNLDLWTLLVCLSKLNFRLPKSKRDLLAERKYLKGSRNSALRIEMPNRERGGGSILTLSIFDYPNKSTKTLAARDDIPAPVGQSRRATPEATPSTPREQQEAVIVRAGAGDSLTAEAPCNASSATLGTSQTRRLGLRIIFPGAKLNMSWLHSSSCLPTVMTICCGPVSNVSRPLSSWILAGISRNYTGIIAQNFALGGSEAEYNTKIYLNSRLPGHGIAEPVEAWLLAGEAAKILEENSWRRILTNRTKTEDERDLPSRRDDLENS